MMRAGRGSRVTHLRLSRVKKGDSYMHFHVYTSLFYMTHWHSRREACERTAKTPAIFFVLLSMAATMYSIQSRNFPPWHTLCTRWDRLLSQGQSGLCGHPPVVSRDKSQLSKTVELSRVGYITGASHASPLGCPSAYGSRDTLLP